MKRSIKINFKNGESEELELSKATTIRTDVEMIHLDKLKDGTWRLIWSEKTISDFTEVDNLEIHRE